MPTDYNALNVNHDGHSLTFALLSSQLHILSLLCGASDASIVISYSFGVVL